MPKIMYKMMANKVIIKIANLKMGIQAKKIYDA